MPELQNTIFRFQIFPENGTFSILTQEGQWPDLLKAHLGLEYRVGKHRYQALTEGWPGWQSGKVATEGSLHGAMQSQTFTVCDLPGGVRAELTFALVQEYPLALWKIKLFNDGVEPLFIDRVTLLEIDPARAGSSLVFQQAHTAAEMGFYHNGWQSWSPAGWVRGDGCMPRTRLGGLQAPMIYNEGTPRPQRRGCFSSDFFAVLSDQKARNGLVLGFLAQREQFGSISADLRGQPQLKMWANGDSVQVNPGATLETDWAVVSPVLLDHREPLEKYFEAVAREYQIKVPTESPVGWCSWYHFYTNLSEKDVEANLDSILASQERLPVQLVQIDDGFESQVGDWFTFKPTFSNGVKPLAQKISAEGLIPGLWLAPFIIHPKSELYHQHPDWILRRANGRPVNAGYVWGTLDTALDLTVPEALQYTCDVIRTAAHEWGYPYLKLDFLYAAALPGKYADPTKTRAQVLRMGMQALRDAMGPEVTLLGCGAPFGSMLGLVEAMRIGPDVSGDWQPTFNGIRAFIQNEPSFPCARNSIRNILTRANLHGHWWVNDPDCLLLRPNTHLSLAEVQTLATAIGMTGGSLLVSDDLPKLPAERLRLAEVLLPVLGQRARVVDGFDAEMPMRVRLDELNVTGEWYLLAQFNWRETAAEMQIDPKAFGLDEASYQVCDFWRETTGVIGAGESYSAGMIPAHGCTLVALRRQTAEATYLGSNLHYSMGMEVAEWQATETEVNFTLRLPRQTEGRVWLALPWQQARVWIDDREQTISIGANGVAELPVQFNGFCRIKIEKK
jgi:alpha-galactosidase